MNQISKHLRLQLAALAVVGILVGQSQRARAGWTGAMTGDGIGWSSVTVISSVLRTNTVKTAASTQNPSASIPPATGYLATGALPKDSSIATIARVKGTNGYAWTATTLGYNGDKSDDDGTIEKRGVEIIPADCAELNTESSAVFAPDGLSGMITVDATGTGGTAILLRGLQWLGDVPPTSVEELEANSVVKWDLLYVGPFDLTEAKCTAIKIPFTTPDAKKLYFVYNGVAKSNPLIVNCTSNVVAKCGAPVVYPPVEYGGCGDIKITYNPPAGSAFPVGVTPVTVTATDKYGDTATCGFTVTVQDTTAPTIPSLPDLTGQSSVTVPVPTATDNCAGTVKGSTADPLFYNKQGTFVVHWVFNDGNGNSTQANQNVIVDDTIPPVTPVLPTVNGTCSGPVTLTRPTTTDATAGTVTGTTTDSLVYSAPGTYTVHWTFNDGNGNSTTANQTVSITGLTFKGFYSPIGGVNNSCSAPLAAKTVGSKLPIKFDQLCGGSSITSGTPPVVRIQKWVNCVQVSEPVVQNAEFQNDWHYNWDTTGFDRMATYKIIVVLSDGTTQYVFVNLK